MNQVGSRIFTENPGFHSIRSPKSTLLASKIIVPNRRLASKLTVHKETLRSLIRYLGIGGFVFLLDIATFQLSIKAGIYRPLATTIAYVLAVTAHFLLNKFFNFRNFDRSTARQLRTYLVVVIFSWLVTLLVIEVSVRWLGWLPLWAKILAIVINIPVGFLANRYLTFGAGIGATLRKWQRQQHLK